MSEPVSRDPWTKARHDLGTPINQILGYSELLQEEAEEAAHSVYVPDDWIYRHLDQAARTMIALAREHPDAAGLERRALNQAARELLLAQSSDWAFIMKTDTMVPYAVKRTRLHVRRLLRLTEMLRNGGVHEDELREMEASDNLLPDIDYRVYAGR